MSNIIQNETKLYNHPIYSQYACNLKGEVFSLKFGKTKKLKPILTDRGYLQFSIYCTNDKKITKRVHQFILECCCVFTTLPEWSTKIGDGMTCNHKNKIKTDNNIFNLEIIPHRNNTKLRDDFKSENKQSGLPLSVYLNTHHFRKKPYNVRIYFKGKTLYFGYYETVKEAEEVAIKQRKLLFPND